MKDEEYKTSIPSLSGEELRLLTTLNFSGHDIILQDPNLIARVLMETVSLKNLDLSRTMLTSDGATKLIGALRNISSLKVFNLNNNDIDDEASESIAAVISSNTLIESINLSHNRLSYVGEVVNINDNFSKSINLATALSKCVVLQELNVSHNFLGFTDVLTIAKIFRYHPTLETLDLSSNSISFSSACKFVVDVILSVNQKLVTLNVCGKNIRPRYIDDYLSPPKSENNSTTFALQTLSIQCSSLNLGNQTDLIKTTETCPIYSDDIASYHVDHVGGVFYNECHNFALVIPPDAVAQGDCVEIQGTANYFGPYMIPDGFYPISSCYWISANYVFKAPVYFIMNHYTKIRSVEDVRNLYVLHKCAKEPNVNGDMMMSVISDGVYFDNNIRYCVLATNHFCSYCQAKSVEHIPEYLTACYCTYDESYSESHIAEVSFCPSSSECRKVDIASCIIL